MKRIEHAFLLIFLFPGVCFSFCFQDAGQQYSISPVLLEALAKIESNLNPNAVHRNGNGSFDIGLMQINSSWMSRLNRRAEDLLTDPCANVLAGAWVLRHCLDTYGYTWQAVGCYNAKSSNKRIDYAWKVFRELKDAGVSSTRKPLRSQMNESSLVFHLHEAVPASQGKDQ